jgi:hypothetical protein
MHMVATATSKAQREIQHVDSPALPDKFHSRTACEDAPVRCARTMLKRAVHSARVRRTATGAPGRCRISRTQSSRAYGRSDEGKHATKVYSTGSIRSSSGADLRCASTRTIALSACVQPRATLKMVAHLRSGGLVHRIMRRRMHCEVLTRVHGFLTRVWAEPPIGFPRLSPEPGRRSLSADT